MISILFTVAPLIFIAELTDKDALLLIAMATKIKPSLVFAAGAVAFTITTAIIVTVGQFLVSFVPVFWFKMVGALIMIGYGFWQFFKASAQEKEEEIEEEQSALMAASKKGAFSGFLGMVSMLALLDLAGDATEVLTLVFVAQFQNALLVFVGAITALVAAAAVETAVGNRLGKVLSPSRIRLFSLLVFLIIGSILLITTLL